MNIAGPKLLEKAASIRLAVFDIDGVMTGGEILLGPDGEEFKRFHVQDGLGLVLLLRSGIEVGVISSRHSQAVSRRMESLGVRHVLQGQSDKLKALQSLLETTGIDARDTAFTGDDLVDLPAMQIAGLSIAVPNARQVVQQQADWITSDRGGEGAVREICELLLEARGMLAQHINHYLRKD